MKNCASRAFHVLLRTVNKNFRAESNLHDMASLLFACTDRDLRGRLKSVLEQIESVISVN